MFIPAKPEELSHISEPAVPGVPAQPLAQLLQADRVGIAEAIDKHEPLFSPRFIEQNVVRIGIVRDNVEPVQRIDESIQRGKLPVAQSSLSLKRRERLCRSVFHASDALGDHPQTT